MIDLIKLASMSTLMQCKSKEVIISPNNAECEHMYFILAGSAGEYTDFNKNTQSKICDYGYGDMFGEIGFFLNVPVGTSIVAEENITLIAVNKASFTAVCQNAPDLMLDIVMEICTRQNANFKNAQHYQTIANSALKKLGMTIDEFSSQALFPTEHKSVVVKEPDTYADFVSPYKLTCPHCSSEFESRTVLTSKLRPDNSGQQRADLRQKYQGFDLIWYDIVSCPHCLFSAQLSNFTKQIYLNRKAYDAKLPELKAKVNPTFTYPKTLDQVFTSYYIALICSEGFENPYQVKARLWLQLSWLYEDNNQPEMVKIAQKNSYESYIEFYSVSTLDSLSTQVCCLILGSLAGKLDLYERALDHLYKAKAVVDGKPVYKLLAEREADIIREDRKAKVAAEKASK